MPPGAIAVDGGHEIYHLSRATHALCRVHHLHGNT